MEKKRVRKEKLKDTRREVSRPDGNIKDMETSIEECKARVADGMRCYCTSICNCRVCQQLLRREGSVTCPPEHLVLEGGCAWGCNQCSECKPCW